MLLAANIGNTNIQIGVFRKGVLLKKFSLPTNSARIFPYIKKITTRYAIDDAIICSVVPTAAVRLEKCVRRLMKKKPYLVYRDIKVPIVNLYRTPRQLGQDRLLNAYAAWKLFGAPAVIVDLGTAITFDAVTKSGHFSGGLILPGLGMCVEALARNTALLPKIRLSRPREFLGKDTTQGIRSGLVYGFAAMAGSLIKKIKEKIGSGAHVIATGGDSRLVAKYCAQLKIIDEDLTLKGMSLLYDSTRIP